MQAAGGQHDCAACPPPPGSAGCVPGPAAAASAGRAPGRGGRRNGARMEPARDRRRPRVMDRAKVTSRPPATGRVRAMAGSTIMSRRRCLRTGRALRRAAVALVPAAAGLVLLAACGTTPAPGTAGAAPAGASGSPAAATTGSGTAQVALCRDAAAVTGLRIVRLDGIRVPEAQPAFPSRATVISPAHARAVARALCALPATPHGIFNCPALFPGTSYQLHFTADGQALPVVTIQATGCETVTGAGQPRRAISAGFWRVLATAAGLSPLGLPAFTAPDCQPHGYPTKVNGCPALSQPAGGLVPSGVQPGGVQPGGPDVPAG
jgi:hypothetical protein